MKKDGKVFCVIGETLIQLVKKYSKTDKESVHGYMSLYQEYFSPYQTKDIKLLEIGIQLGDSIRMWNDYFENGNIFGIDIDHVHMINENCFIIDAGKREDLKKLVDKCGKFDIIIDDGSHNMVDHQISLGYLFKYLKLGGIYVIEDLLSQDYKSNPGPFNKFNKGHLYHRNWKYKEKKENNTLDMLKKIISDKVVISEYMLDDEKKYLENNIKSIKLYDTKYKDNICFIVKGDK